MLTTRSMPTTPSRPTRPRHGALAFAVLAAIVGACLSPRTSPAAPLPPPVTLESGWSVEGFVDPNFAAQRAQIVFDANRTPTCIYAGHTTDATPFQILWSQATGLSTWSPSQPAFAPTPAKELLPQASRAPDGTVWIAWLRDNNDVGRPFVGNALLAARFVNGTWSAPETVMVGLPVVDPQTPRVGFSILAAGADSAWIAWSQSPDLDPLSSDLDLFYSVRSAAGWSAPGLVSNTGLTESHPVLLRTTDGSPAALFTAINSPATLSGSRWNGAAWVAQPTDQFFATTVYDYDAAPDTGGAVRVVAFLRETTQAGLEDHLRELVWNAGGFTEGTTVSTLPVPIGAEHDPPDWSGISIAEGRACPACSGPVNDRIYRVTWLDFSTGLPGRVFSSMRTDLRYEPFEGVGTSFELDHPFTMTAQDPAFDRWYAMWDAPPSSQGLDRARFAYSQTFAGDLDLGANLVLPDTVRVTIVCTGDATGRVFNLYRIKVDAGQADPAFPPPIPAGAVPLVGNPYSGQCPFDIDDRPGPGRWFYYAVLESQGTFPERDARAILPVVVPDSTGGGGGNGTPTRSALLVPRPQPSRGPVSLPYDLAADADVSILIRDVRGGLVRILVIGPRVAGAYRDYNAPVWDGLDGTGRSARSGIYFATLTANGKAVGGGQHLVHFP
jgi:hypothetical protein